MLAVEERLSVLEGQMQEVGAALVRVEGTLGSLQQFLIGLDRRVERVEQRFDKLEHRFDNLETRFDKLETRFDRLEGRFDRLDLRVDKLDERMLKLFLWVIGIQMTTLIAFIGGLFGLVAKLI